MDQLPIFIVGGGLSLVAAIILSQMARPKKKRLADREWKDRLRNQLAAEEAARKAVEDECRLEAARIAALPEGERLAIEAEQQAVRKAKDARIAEATRARLVEMETKRISLEAEKTWGPINPVMICPHCQEKGSIRTKRIEKKGGVSGTKAAGAMLTGGLSVMVTGLSVTDTLTQSHCENCSNSWVF